MGKMLNKRRIVEGTVQTCHHYVAFWYDIENIPRSTEMVERLTEAAEERAKEMIIEGYHSGELNCTVNERHEEVRGWWEIDKEEPEEKKSKGRQPVPDRICFDVTLKGYNRLDEMDAFEEDDENILEVERLLGDLVKWIVAPNKRSLDSFLKKNKLADLLNGPPTRMSDHSSANYGLAEGIDFILGPHGVVLEGDLSVLDGWRLEVAKAEKLLL